MEIAAPRKWTFSKLLLSFDINIFYTGSVVLSVVSGVSLTVVPNLVPSLVQSVLFLVLVALLTIIKRGTSSRGPFGPNSRMGQQRDGDHLKGAPHFTFECTFEFLNFYFLDLVFKSLEIHTVHGRKIFHTWEECEKLIQSGAVKPGLVMKNCCHPIK